MTRQYFTRQTMTFLRKLARHNDRDWFEQNRQVYEDALRRQPRGYAKDHPLLDDIRRKDFIAMASLEDDLVLSPRLQKQVLARFKASDPFMRFLCTALELQY